MVTQCPYCQHRNRPQARFCEECGGSLSRACTACGTALSLSAKFCSECSHPVQSVLQPGSTGLATLAYAPAHLKERILSTPAARDGERKQVTVLFADLRASMDLVAGQDPEEARTILDAVLERMMEAVHRYEGTVSQVMGDGVMALFGAPLAHEDHAVRACYAALDMQQSVRAYADEIGRTPGRPLQMRVGLNSGQVVARAMQSDIKTDYTAVGETTHLAARMEQLAVPGTIVMTAETQHLVEGHVDARPLGSMAVKGLARPVEAFEVLGAVEARSRLHAGFGRELTPFVGRQDEVEALRRALERSAAKHGQVLAVVGDPGVGKTRLVLEFARSRWTRGWRILEGGAFSYEKATPYRAVAGLLRAYFRLHRQDDHWTVADKVTEGLTAIDLPLDSTAPALLAVLDAPVADPGWKSLSADQRRRRTLDAVRGVLLRASEVEPLLVALEDLHWIDAESQAVLDHLVDGLLGARLLLLVTYRPEYQHGWANRASYGQLRLEPLPVEGARELLARLLGDRDDLEPLKALLVTRTEGNPFFLEESVRTLIEIGALTGAPGAYRLARPVEAVRVPATVEAVLAARIDRLPTPEKELLQCAAVIGRDVPFPLLRDIADQAEDDLRRNVARLQAAEFVYETRLFPEVEYTFKHALTQEVAYRALLQAQSRVLHARIVEAFERLYPERVGEHVERLADHAVHGELWPKAAAYLRRAGGKAATRGAAREAAATFERALGALGRLEERRELIEEAIEVRLELHNTLVPLGDLKRILASLTEAEALAERLGDPRRTGQVASAMSHFFWWTGEPSRSAEFGHRAWDVAARGGDLTLQVVTNLRLVQAYFAMGDYRRVAEVGQWSLDTLTGDLAKEAFGLPALPAVTIRAFVGRSIATLGEFEPGMALVEDGVRLAQEVGHPYTSILAAWGAGDAYLMRGDLTRAIAALERGLDLCRRGDFGLMIPIIGRILGEAYAMAGRHQEAAQHVQRSVEDLTAMRYIPALPSAWAGLGEVHLLAARLPEALEAALHADMLCEQHGQHGTRAGVLRLLGDIHAAGQPPKADESEAAYRRALALAERLGMRPLIARCHLGLGKLWARVGRRADALEQLGIASKACYAMALEPWTREADTARLALTGRSG